MPRDCLCIIFRSYTRIRENSDAEWKYSFIRIVLEYGEGGGLPSPFNLLGLGWILAVYVYEKVSLVTYFLSESVAIRHSYW